MAQPSFLKDNITFQTEPTENVPGSENNTDDIFIDDTISNILDGTTAATFNEYLSPYSYLPKMYVEDNIRDTKGRFGHILSVAHDVSTEKFVIGYSELNLIPSKEFIIKALQDLWTPF